MRVQYTALAEHWAIQEFRCRMVLFCQLIAARFWDKVGKAPWCGCPCLGAGHQQSLQLYSAGSKGGTEREHLTIKRQDSNAPVLGQTQSSEVSKKTSLDQGQSSRTLSLSFLFISQSLTCHFFLPFLLLPKLLSRNDSVLMLSVWQMACPWQLYSTNPVLYSSAT